jgi:hypothetical protein
MTPPRYTQAHTRNRTRTRSLASHVSEHTLQIRAHTRQLMDTSGQYAAQKSEIKATGGSCLPPLCVVCPNFRDLSVRHADRVSLCVVRVVRVACVVCVVRVWCGS